MYDPNYNSLAGGPYQVFVSRPDLNPPLLNVNGTGSPGFLFFAQRGTSVHQSSLLITDNNGTVIYVNPQFPNAFNFLPQTYENNRVLTFWNGTLFNGFGQGSYLMMDPSYNILANFTSIKATPGDLHEFNIVNNTALITIYDPVPADLRSIGGNKTNYVYSGRFQQIDLCTTKVLFDWTSINHVAVNDTYNLLDGAGAQDNPFDYFHINAIDIHPTDGSFLVSSRHTSTVYKINSTTGNIIWRLGGKQNNFTMGEGTNFENQHDARWRSPTDITLFDNAAQDGNDVNETQTRGLYLTLDTDNMTATLKTQLINPFQPLSYSQGNLQVLPNGNFFMGYGSYPLGAEYDVNGTIVSQIQLTPSGSDVESYRMFKMDWTSTPDTIPDIALADRTVFVSWNGATAVNRWNIYMGPNVQSLSLYRVVNKTGFETAFRFPTTVNILQNFTQIGAINAAGKIMALTQVVRGDGETFTFDQSNIKVNAPSPTNETFQCLPTLVQSPAARRETSNVFVLLGLAWLLLVLFRRLLL